MLLVLLSTLALAATLPSDLDPTTNPRLGPREDAVGSRQSDPEATEVLIQVLKTDPAVEIRARAGKALFDRWEKRIGDPEAHRQAAIWAAAHSDPGIRASAIRVLGDVGDDPTLITPYLADANASVRAAAHAACERWAARHPDRAGEVRPLMNQQPLSTEDKARKLFETVKGKIP